MLGRERGLQELKGPGPTCRPARVWGLAQPQPLPQPRPLPLPQTQPLPLPLPQPEPLPLPLPQPEPEPEPLPPPRTQPWPQSRQLLSCPYLPLLERRAGGRGPGGATAPRLRRPSERAQVRRRMEPRERGICPFRCESFQLQLMLPFWGKGWAGAQIEG